MPQWEPVDGIFVEKMSLPPQSTKTEAGEAATTHYELRKGTGQDGQIGIKRTVFFTDAFAKAAQ
jgi:hypothetical protein